MTFSAFLLILASAGFHASWNLLSKSKRPSMAFYMQASMTAAIMWLGITIWGIQKVNWSTVPGVFYIMVVGTDIVNGLGNFLQHKGRPPCCVSFVMIIV